jgi:hypothetical protein
MKKKPNPVRKAFPAYDRPKTPSYAVIVVEWHGNSAMCQFTDRCNREKVGVCPIYGRTFCAKHTSKETITIYDNQNSTVSGQVPLCLRCKQLPRHIRTQVLAFREQLKR